MDTFQNLPHLGQEKKEEIAAPWGCKSGAIQRTV